MLLFLEDTHLGLELGTLVLRLVKRVVTAENLLIEGELLLLWGLVVRVDCAVDLLRGVSIGGLLLALLLGKLATTLVS